MRFLFIIFLMFALGCSQAEKKEAAKIAEKVAKVVVKEAAKEVLKEIAAGPGAPESAVINCVNKDDKRTIEIKKSGDGCEVVYNKFGKEFIPASARYHPEFCHAKASQIRGNLLRADFVCN